MELYLYQTIEVHLVSVDCNLWSSLILQTWKRNVVFARFELGLDVSVPQPLKGSNWDAYAIYMLCTKSSKERTNWQSLVSALKSSKVEETAQISYFQGTEGIHSWIIILTIHWPINNQLTQYNCCIVLDLVEDLDPWGYDWPKLLYWNVFCTSRWSVLNKVRYPHWPH